MKPRNGAMPVPGPTILIVRPTPSIVVFVNNPMQITLCFFALSTYNIGVESCGGNLK
jgi:hypothetical protein